jgi:hypothetical protein
VEHAYREWLGKETAFEVFMIDGRIDLLPESGGESTSPS